MKPLGTVHLSVPPRGGVPGRRAEIVEDVARQGLPARADAVVGTGGSQQALDLVARTLVNPGEPFLVDESTYTGALNVLATAGARLVGVPSDEDGPELAALARLERSGAKG